MTFANRFISRMVRSSSTPPSRHASSLFRDYSFYRVFLRTCALIIFPAQWLSSHHFQIYRVTGESMTPTLSPDFHETGKQDYVFFRKNCRLQATPASDNRPSLPCELKRGMIVATCTPHDPERIAIKRIVALEGDTITPRAQSISESLKQEIMGLHDVQPRHAITVPFAHVWLEGDNAEKSLDSNHYGPISKSLIEGVATKIVFPRFRAGSPRWVDDGWEQLSKGRVVRRATEDEPIPPEWAIY